MTIWRANEIIYFDVQDSGVGIDEKQINSLFTLFKKIQDDRQLNKNGCGLGLNISKKMAKALQGDIKVVS